MPLTICAKIGDSKFSILIDTGASISILPPNLIPNHRVRPTSVSISNASGDKIKTYGEIDVEVALPSIRRSFNWTFLVADVVGPILGVDFLARHALLVDCSTRKLIDARTNCTVPLVACKIVVPKELVTKFKVIYNVVSNNFYFD